MLRRRADRQVEIVGCGRVGSQLAALLAASGVGLVRPSTHNRSTRPIPRLAASAARSRPQSRHRGRRSRCPGRVCPRRRRRAGGAGPTCSSWPPTASTASRRTRETTPSCGNARCWWRESGRPPAWSARSCYPASRAACAANTCIAATVIRPGQARCGACRAVDAWSGLRPGALRAGRCTGRRPSAAGAGWRPPHGRAGPRSRRIVVIRDTA